MGKLWALRLWGLGSSGLGFGGFITRKGSRISNSEVRAYLEVSFANSLLLLRLLLVRTIPDLSRDLVHNINIYIYIYIYIYMYI